MEADPGLSARDATAGPAPTPEADGAAEVDVRERGFPGDAAACGASFGGGAKDRAGDLAGGAWGAITETVSDPFGTAGDAWDGAKAAGAGLGPWAGRRTFRRRPKRRRPAGERPPVLACRCRKA